MIKPRILLSRLNNIQWILFIFLFTQCVDSETITIRYAHSGVQNEWQTMFAEEVAGIVNEKSEGRVRIILFPNSQMGNTSEMVDGVKSGSIGMSHNDFSVLSKYHKNIAVFNVPYLYRDVDHVLQVTRLETSPILTRMSEELVNSSGIRIIGSFFRGTRHLTTNFPVYSTADLKGRKIRGVPYPVWMSMIKGMGGIPTPVEFAELTTALLTGLVVGQENPLDNIYTARIYEVQSHIIMTHHMHSCLSVIINERVWNRLSEVDQDIIRGAVDEASSKAVEWITREDNRIIKELQAKGVIFIDESDGLDINDFKSSALKQVNLDYPEWDGFIREIQQM